MAAELTYNAAGQAQIAYFGETPWHKEGVKLTVEETHDFNSVFEKVELNYPLEKRPYYRPSNITGELTPSKEAFYVVRADTGGILHENCGPSYEPVDNRTAFETLKPLVDVGVATIETAGVLRDGADAWLMVRWDLMKFGAMAQDLFGGQGIQPFSAVLANHSGRRGITLGNTPIRIVCANTLAVAERDAQGKGFNRWAMVNHRKGAASRLVQEAESLFNSVISQYERLAEQYWILQQTRLTQEQFEQTVLDAIAPWPESKPNFNPEAKMAELVRNRVETKRNALQNAWLSGIGHTGEPTAWYALNGAVEVIDHNRELFPQRSGSWRTAKLLTGDLAKAKDLVADNLMSLALSV